MLIFCAAPFTNGVDPLYADEYAAGLAQDIACHLLDFEALAEANDVARAVRRIPAQPMPITAIYRGWMARSAQFADLYAALAARRIVLINDPPAYRCTHELPGWYSLLADHTPRTIILPREDFGMGNDSTAWNLDAVIAALAPFGDSSIIVKDYVKSRKHEWFDACYIPCASNRAAVARVVGNFITGQGPDLVGGLVFREYVALAPLGVHPQSGMPLAQEFRIFFLDGAPVFWSPYWHATNESAAPPPLAVFQSYVAAIPSRFFTMDVARTQAGEWLVIELGDGQVAGLPDGADPATFIAALAPVVTD
jgi:hypothetical protein